VAGDHRFMLLDTQTVGRAWLSLSTVRGASLAVLAVVVGACFTWPGVTLVRDLADPAMAGPGIPRHAVSLHRDLTERFTGWARERGVSRRAAGASLHDVPSTEWPMFSAVFYLLGTVELERAAHAGLIPESEAPMRYAGPAVEAARSLITDPVEHSWVRTHWGPNYLHTQNVFFRALLISGLTSHAELTHDGSSLPMLRDQVETLAAELDASPFGILDDYPGECYPIDVLTTVGLIRRADRVLGTDHSAFVTRELRAFTGARADRFGLPRFRVSLPSGREEQPSRGIGTSWSLVFAPELWPEQNAQWYATYEEHFWQDHGWAAGFREYAPGTEPEWGFEIDAGPVFDGFGTAASAFGIAAARRNGRFDHASTLSAELAASSWPLPGGTLLLPRTISHAADAPYLGESAILYFLTVQPLEGLPVVQGGRIPGSVWFALLVYLGPTVLVLALARRERRPVLDRAAPAGLLWAMGALGLGAIVIAMGGYLVAAVLMVGLAMLLPLSVSSKRGAEA
jgi:hypothetical protein